MGKRDILLSEKKELVCSVTTNLSGITQHNIL